MSSIGVRSHSIQKKHPASKSDGDFVNFNEFVSDTKTLKVTDETPNHRLTALAKFDFEKVKERRFRKIETRIRNCDRYTSHRKKQLIVVVYSRDKRGDRATSMLKRKGGTKPLSGHIKQMVGGPYRASGCSHLPGSYPRRAEFPHGRAT